MTAEAKKERKQQRNADRPHHNEDRRGGYNRRVR
eukprot:CAMPEP_0119057966 /NCGR_PEP_ID=MMETSP1178-20130426/2353_1 /TAXON_ID=33656 /ORGANISM="unid sp, Strain CCMP2000" /LENGTH=33 /DNA_ID= /DNA_START= /DNA_END= /DNA_ORIENTATION=